MKAAEVRKDGAGKGEICGLPGDMPQPRRDVEQSTIGYKHAYHGEGGRVMFGKDPSQQPAAARGRRHGWTYLSSGGATCK
jgi:hypothetical protein